MRRSSFVLCAVIVATHLLLLWNRIIHCGPTPDEKAYIVGGMAIWREGRFDVYSVNPPLVKLAAALPALIMGAATDNLNTTQSIHARPEFALGNEFVVSNPERWWTFVILGRALLAMTTVIGAFVCWKWANALYGTNAAFVALTLWCFCPNLLAWNSVIGSDGLAASIGVAACYTFWRWLMTPNWPATVVAGVALGFAQLTKMTLIIFLPLWTVLWLGWYFCSLGRTQGRTQITQLFAIIFIGIYVLNSGYTFKNTCTQLGDFRFYSRLLAGHKVEHLDEGNRFEHSVAGWLPVPLPADYVRGVDLQKADFEEGKPSYLFGQWADRGWWYYYFVGLAVKTPLGTIALALLAACWGTQSFCRAPAAWITANGAAENLSQRQAQFAPLVLLTTATAIATVVSLQTGFSCHFRYVLPALPFFFIWASRVGTVISGRQRFASCVVVFLLVASVSSSLAVYPHCMSYFNIMAGGPRQGHTTMLDSSFSWGQDTYFLKDWLNRQLPGEIPFVTISAGVPIEEIGIPTRGPSLRSLKNSAIPDCDFVGPVPGWHAIEKQYICEAAEYAYFSRFEPEASVGYSISIFHITVDSANRVRRNLGLSEISNSVVSQDDFTDRLTRDAMRQRAAHLAIFITNNESTAPKELTECLPTGSWIAVDASAIQNGRLQDVDLLVMPGGRASLQSESLGSQGRNQIREFVRSGGGYLGICAGAFLGSSTFDWSLSMVNAESPTGTHYVPGVGYKMWLERGSGELQVAPCGVGETIFGPKIADLQVQYTGGPIFVPGRRTDLFEYITLANYASEVHQFEFQKGTMIGKPAIIAAPYGLGKVILIGSHLEVVPQSYAAFNTLINAAAASAR